MHLLVQLVAYQHSMRCAPARAAYKLSLRIAGPHAQLVLDWHRESHLKQTVLLTIVQFIFTKSILFYFGAAAASSTPTMSCAALEKHSPAVERPPSLTCSSSCERLGRARRPSENKMRGARRSSESKASTYLWFDASCLTRPADKDQPDKAGSTTTGEASHADGDTQHVEREVKRRSSADSVHADCDDEANEAYRNRSRPSLAQRLSPTRISQPRHSSVPRPAAGGGGRPFLYVSSHYDNLYPAYESKVSWLQEMRQVFDSIGVTVVTSRDHSPDNRATSRGHSTKKPTPVLVLLVQGFADDENGERKAISVFEVPEIHREMCVHRARSSPPTVPCWAASRPPISAHCRL